MPRSNKKPAHPSTPASAPAPFTAAPSALRPFLSCLDQKLIYITHVDRTAVAQKQRIFVFALVLNAALTALLLWRIIAIAPFYASLVASAFGNAGTAATTTTADSYHSRSWPALLREIGRRWLTFCVDGALLHYVVKWPLGFFAPLDGPAAWRWLVGVREREIVVRVSRGWGSAALVSEECRGGGQRAAKGNMKGMGDDEIFRERIIPAVARDYVRAKTGYLMIDRWWDLDFRRMVEATRMVDQELVEEELFEKTVIMFCGEEIGWCVWELHRLDEGAEEEGRRKIVQFRERLTEMGKENLFFRWIEIIQYESSQSEGFTLTRQRAAMEKTRELFCEQNVDFDEFAASIGGVGSMPGMESK